MEKKYRYPGVRPFETTEKKLFFGRHSDIENIYNLILLEKIVVLFSTSGYGKSSLLNAGIIPKFEHTGEDTELRYQPISIRFGAFDEDKKSTPLELTTEKIQGKEKNGDFPTSLESAPRLWHWAKVRQQHSDRHLLLIFDQFEEFFTYPTAQQNQFNRELAELLYTTLPQEIRTHPDFQKLDDEQLAWLVQPLGVKVVFAIRSDRLQYLNSMSGALPAILHKRYELGPLSWEQALAAIVGPAKKRSLAEGKEKKFISPPFTYSGAVLNKIKDSLCNNQSATNKGIETFQLQIICQHLENKIIQGEIKNLDEKGRLCIQETDLPYLNDLYSAYYNRQLERLIPEKRLAAHTLIEEGLLFQNKETGEARRLSVDGRSLVTRFRDKGVGPELLRELENVFLLRREPNNTGGFNFEISHDTLLPPILKARTERQAEAERLAAKQLLQEEKKKLEEAARRREEELERKERERALQEREKQLQEENQRREEEMKRKEAEIRIQQERERLEQQAELQRKTRRLNLGWGALASILTVVGIIFLFLTISQKKEVVATKERVETAQDSLTITEYSLNLTRIEIVNLNFDRYFDFTEDFVLAEHPTLAKQSLDSLYGIIPPDSMKVHQEKIDRLEQKIKELESR